MCQGFGRKENQSGDSQMVFWAALLLIYTEKNTMKEGSMLVFYCWKVMGGMRKNLYCSIQIIETKPKLASSGISFLMQAPAPALPPYEWEEKYQSNAKISNALKIFLPHTWSQLEGVSAKKQRWIFFTQETLGIMNNNTIHADSLLSTL